MVQWPILNNCQCNLIKMVAKLFSQWNSGCTCQMIACSPIDHNLRLIFWPEWPDLAKYRHFRQFLVSFSIWHFFNLLCQFLSYCSNIHCCKWPNIEQIILPACHTDICNRNLLGEATPETAKLSEVPWAKIKMFRLQLCYLIFFGKNDFFPIRSHQHQSRTNACDSICGKHSTNWFLIADIFSKNGKTFKLVYLNGVKILSD